MSITESSKEAKTLIEPVSHAVAVLSKIRKPAAMMESNATEFLAARSLSGVKWGSLRADNDAILLTDKALIEERK